MTTKAELKHLRSLQQKKYRESTGLYLVQGPKLYAELLRSERPVEAVYATAAAIDRYDLRGANELPDHELDRIGTLESGNELVAVLRHSVHPKVVALDANEFVLALDGISDPGNLGTLLRIADWFGIKRILCTPNSVEVWNPKCVQASMGAIFRVACLYVDLAPFIKVHLAKGVAVYTASMEGNSVFDTQLERPAILVLGSESHGLSEPVLALRTTMISVPKLGEAESLNVAMAASALCMEFTRQMR